MAEVVAGSNCFAGQLDLGLIDCADGGLRGGAGGEQENGAYDASDEGKKGYEDND